MKKAELLIIFFLLVAYSFADELPNGNIDIDESIEINAINIYNGIGIYNRNIYITGTAEQEEHKTFFMSAFLEEAAVVGLDAVNYREEAGFILEFQVQGHTIEHEPHINYIILMSLVNNETGAEVLSFGWPFAGLEDMHEYTPFLFHMTTALIPQPPDDEIERVVYVLVHDTRWQNQRLYLRVSVDYPIIFYALQPTGLAGGQAAYVPGPPGAPPAHVQFLDHIIMPRPGLTVGVEWMFLNFMSIELNLHGNFGDPRTYRFFNIAAGTQLRGVLRTRNFMFQPYAALSVPLNVSPEFSEFPLFAIGGGAQIGTRGSSRGVVFLDLNFMISMGDVYRYNPFGATAPQPSRIHYRRFSVGFGIGYKLGFFERR